MASESVSVSGPVEIESTSREAVAFELMKYIAAREKVKDELRESRETLNKPPKNEATNSS